MPLLLFLAFPAFSQEEQTPEPRKIQKDLARISVEDLRRTGATTLSEALRRVPDLSVRRKSSKQWGIGLRSFISVHANEFLVLTDGRRACTPLIEERVIH